MPFKVIKVKDPLLDLLGIPHLDLSIKSGKGSVSVTMSSILATTHAVDDLLRDGMITKADRSSILALAVAGNLADDILDVLVRYVEFCKGRRNDSPISFVSGTNKRERRIGFFHLPGRQIDESPLGGHWFDKASAFGSLQAAALCGVVAPMIGAWLVVDIHASNLPNRLAEAERATIREETESDLDSLLFKTTSGHKFSEN